MSGAHAAVERAFRSSRDGSRRPVGDGPAGGPRIAPWGRTRRGIAGQHPEAVLSPEVLGSVAAPTLLLWGADDPIGGASTAEAFAPLLPSGELIVLDTSSHAPWVDDPATCAHHIEAFLTR